MVQERNATSRWVCDALNRSREWWLDIKSAEKLQLVHEKVRHPNLFVTGTSS